MELREFVAESLKQIVLGVTDAQGACAVTDAVINPKGLLYRNTEAVLLQWSSDGRRAERVDFDIAVSTVDATKTKGGIGVFVGPVGLGSQGHSDNSNSSESRIKFSLMILFPSSQKEEKHEA
ncbi:MAG: hypothetical protein WCS99_11050 [Limisphaerales bacterium]